MLFHVYGDAAVWQWIAMIGVLLGLILLNEFSRRSKFGGIFMFFAVPLALTAYFAIAQQTARISCFAELPKAAEEIFKE